MKIYTAAFFLWAWLLYSSYGELINLAYVTNKLLWQQYPKSHVLNFFLKCRVIVIFKFRSYSGSYEVRPFWQQPIMYFSNYTVRMLGRQGYHSSEQIFFWSWKQGENKILPISEASVRCWLHLAQQYMLNLSWYVYACDPRTSNVLRLVFWRVLCDGTINGLVFLKWTHSSSLWCSE